MSRPLHEPSTRQRLIVLAVGALIGVGGGWALGTTDARPRPAYTPRTAEVEALPALESHAAQPEAALGLDANPTATSGPSCDDAQTQARAAFDRRRWREVLEHTARNVCWSSKHERVLLRTTALFNLGRWGECVRLSTKSNDPKVRSIADACEAATKLDRLESK